MARANGKVTGTAKRLLAMEAAQRETNERLEGIDAHLMVMTEHLARQADDLTAIRHLLAEALPLRTGDPAALIKLFWSEGRIALSLLNPGSR